MLYAIYMNNAKLQMAIHSNENTRNTVARAKLSGF